MPQFLRLLVIQRVLISHGLDEIIFATHLLRPVRFIFYILPWNWFNKHKEKRAVRIRLMLEELGPIYVKLGQILSTRRDLIPKDIADEFAKLQDNVAPFSGKIAREIIEDAYGRNINDIFSKFDETPLASASVAQVHSATLKDGRKFIIKVIRPGIESLIRKDLDLLHLLAKKAEKYNKNAKSLKFTGVIKEFEKTIFNELDLQREASNASQLYRNFVDEKRYHVPKIDWELTKRNVLAIERVEGIPIRDIDALKAADIPAATIDTLVHGSTTATNALVERSYPPAAMIATEGFRDVIEIVAIAEQTRETLGSWVRGRPRQIITEEFQTVIGEKMH